MKKHILISRTGRKLALIKNFPAKMRYILIACHGFLGGKENGGWINLLSSRLESLNIGLVAFDFEGCGESEGDFSAITLSRQASNLQDVMAYVEKEHNLPLFLLGRSFGGSTVLAASNYKNVAGYILWSTPVFLVETFANILPENYQKLEKGRSFTYTENNQTINLKSDLFIDFAHHNMDEYLQNIKDSPLLAIHGTNDKVVKANNCQHIVDQLPHAQIHLVEGADHSFIGMEEHRINLTTEWLAKNF